MREISPKMRSAKEDTIRLKAILRKPFSNTNILVLTPSKIADFRDEHLTEVSAGYEFAQDYQEPRLLSEWWIIDEIVLFGTTKHQWKVVNTT